MNNPNYFDSLLGDIKTSSVRRMFDVLAKSCIDYHPDSLLFARIQRKMSEIDERDQVLVANKVIEEIMAAANSHIPMTTREFERCVDAEVERHLRQVQDEMSLAGLHSPVVVVYEEGADGKMHAVGTTTKIYDTDGNKAVYHSQQLAKRNGAGTISNDFFPDSICNDTSISNLLFRVLHETILPKISTKLRHTSYSWGHLYHTLFGLDLIVYCKRDKEKAKALQSIYGNKVSIDTIHGQIKNRKFPDGKFTEWGEQDADRLICQEMAKWRQPVVDNIMSKSSDHFYGMEIW